MKEFLNSSILNEFFLFGQKQIKYFCFLFSYKRIMLNEKFLFFHEKIKQFFHRKQIFVMKIAKMRLIIFLNMKNIHKIYINLSIEE